jgi:CheY-like chemotaxis protein
MNITCKNCSKKITLSNKIQKGVKRLVPGRTLRLPCPNCKEAIVLSSNNLSPDADYPDTSSIKPPSPPDITWLKEGAFEEEEVVEDIPQALILIKTGIKRENISKSIESIGYQASFAETSQEAIEKMQFVNFASVILHSDFEAGDMEQSSFHQFMRDMHMSKRRFIFYILVGMEFATLYDLEALANSANLVVNDREIPELLTILRKAIPSYEELFGSLMAEISAYSR